MRPSLDELKEHLRIDGEDEDDYLQLTLDTAIFEADKMSGRGAEEVFTDLAYHRFVLLKCGELHGERTGNVAGNQVAIRRYASMLRTGLGVGRLPRANTTAGGV